MTQVRHHFSAKARAHITATLLWCQPPKAYSPGRSRKPSGARCVARRAAEFAARRQSDRRNQDAANALMQANSCAAGGSPTPDSGNAERLGAFPIGPVFMTTPPMDPNEAMRSGRVQCGSADRGNQRR